MITDRLRGKEWMRLLDVYVYKWYFIYIFKTFDYTYKTNIAMECDKDTQTYPYSVQRLHFYHVFPMNSLICIFGVSISAK